MPFEDRRDAGARLAAALGTFRHEDPVVIGLTRGGVPVAAEVARALGATLDVRVVRKIGAPIQPELGLGAIAEGGGRWLDPHIVALTGTTRAQVAEVEAEERARMEARIARYRRVRAREPLAGRTVIVVDDGIATGGTVHAALEAIRSEGPRKLVLAVPVAAASSLRALAPLADAVVCIEPEEHLFAIGAWYRDFSQTSDEEVVSLLERARREPAATRAHP